jgi:hypothetical protein
MVAQNQAKPRKAEPKSKEPRKDRVRIAAEELPRRTLEDSLRVAEALHRNYAGKSASWDEIAAVIRVNPTYSQNKYPLWSALAYGLITRTEDDQFSLAETARKILAPNYPGEDREGKVKALLTPKMLSKFLTDCNGHTLPDRTHFPNVLENRYQIPRDRTAEAIDLITSNGRFAGILHDQPDGTTLVKLDDSGIIVEKTPAPSDAGAAGTQVPADQQQAPSQYDWQKTCFFITPIGEEASDQRRHADMMLKHAIEPVAKEFGLQVVRADKIERSGLITQQIFEQLARAKLCIADLSFTNANVFYELGVRHTCKLPTIQLIRKSDRIPFDVSQGRTIVIDTTDIYLIADRLESARKELAEHVRHILASDPGEPGDDNPVHLYLPKLKVTIQD